ncbi:MAG TPA: helix-hairpin-helix domain-containing protein, partial [Thermoanaerobaculia bacterium]|nr:helix-hairpin-helix domain-containing protein [Thermoanaerobaculia bacterium]
QMPDAKKQAKLSFMAASADEQLLSYAAWPQETLHTTRNGPVAGFLMPKIANRAPIHMLYSPAHRRQDYPKAAWDFLLFSARNIAAAFSTLHAHGHVLGDVNQGNVMVGADSKVMLIDCDSFQINARGVMHLCEVGVSHFTPPELQGLPSFEGVTRGFNHDNFGLALLIFHLLFGGRHPYSGVPLRKDVGEALESDIKAFRFAYARDAQSRGVAPPPKSIPLSAVPVALEAMFEQAFTEKGVSGGRPSAQQWVSTLDHLRNRLRKCGATPMHVYSDHLSRCPWCELEDRGVVYFIDLGMSFTHTASGFVFGKAWAMIEAVTPPSPVVVPNVASISVSPRPLPSGITSKRQVFVLRFLVVFIAIGIFAAAPAAGFFILLGSWIAWGLSGSVGASERNAERGRRQAILDEARREYEALAARLRKEAGPEGFTAKKQWLASLRDEYHALAATEKCELERLHATAEARQKRQYLDRCFLDSATITGVGPAKKAALRSFGIETAADVDWNKVRSVKGFGDVLTRAVVDWRKSCERRFVFNPNAAVSAADKNAVRARIAARRRVLEESLSSGASDLQRFRQDAASKVTALRPQLDSAAQKLAQAQADRSIL